MNISPRFLKTRTGLLMVLAFALTHLSPGQQVQVPTPKQNSQVPLVTFVELGSVKCVPCRMMQPVLKSVENKYGSQIKVIFYDIWKEDQKHFAEAYKVRVIPTQIFLDRNGKEIFRHEGFFPESEIDHLLHRHGLKVMTDS